jgi:hypothetical protein
MTSMTSNSPPAASVKVRLLQDAVYSEDANLWSALLRYQAHIEAYFRDIGLELVVHEDDGFAYLKQIPSEDAPGIPPLFRRDKLTKGVAIIGVVLREQLLAFDEKIHDESQLMLRKAEILELATPFFPNDNDEIRAKRRVETAFNKAEEMGLVRKRNESDGQEWYEVRRIVKARFEVGMLKELQRSLQSHTDANDNEQ